MKKIKNLGLERNQSRRRSDMPQPTPINYGLVYLSVSCAMFLLGVLLGNVFRVDVIHGGMRLGIFNSFVLSFAWPVTFLLIVIGWAIDSANEFGRL